MRMLRHLFAPSSAASFPPGLLDRIAAAIADSEARHTGEICFAVEGGLPFREVLAGRSPRDRAVEVFSRLRVWDTEANNGVLVYLLLADRAIEIVADRALARRVDEAEWSSICRELEAAMRDRRCEAGVMAAIARISSLLEAHFPRSPDYVDSNELPDRPRLL